ncbi:hypothetical protein OUZ56_013685 [Daphnia magna]|uniref:Uncharacterized protein n=1 Tax=Daphnia magna TaxID=35525 RepID=A0ABQ9Z6N0_9CRUS|nr:hypothetical protein OUZ56_013685 [Daphnia magna]
MKFFCRTESRLMNFALSTLGIPFSTGKPFQYSDWLTQKTSERHHYGKSPVTVLLIGRLHHSAVKAESPLDLNFDEQMCLIAIVGDKTFTATTIKEDTTTWVQPLEDVMGH